MFAVTNAYVDTEGNTAAAPEPTAASDGELCFAWGRGPGKLRWPSASDSTATSVHAVSASDAALRHRTWSRSR